jgi:transcriptional regulator with XRE-family HTH domain
MKIDGNRLRAMRETRGWSQDQLAEFAGVNSRTVQRLEQRGSAALETMKAIAATLNVEIPELTASPNATGAPSPEPAQPQVLGTHGPLLAALTDALKETHHWRQHFNDLFTFRSFFFRKPDPPLFQALEQQAYLASTVSLQLHQDVSEGLRQLKKLGYEVQSFGGHIRSLSSVGYHVSAGVQQEATVIGNSLCDAIEFYLGRARKELLARVYPLHAA